MTLGRDLHGRSEAADPGTRRDLMSRGDAGRHVILISMIEDARTLVSRHRAFARRGLWLATGAGIAVVLGGCSITTGTEAEIAPDPSATAGNRHAYLPGGSDGPLDDAIGWSAMKRMTSEDYVDQIRTEQQYIAQCMAEQGFEYAPELPELGSGSVDVDEPEGSPEFVAEFGYGIWADDYSTPGGFSWKSGAGADENQARMDAMSHPQTQAYLSALRGNATWVDGMWVTEAPGGGCADQARDLTSPIPSDEYLASVYDEGREFLFALPDNSAFDDLDAQWAECMREDGRSYSSPRQAQDHFYDLKSEQLERYSGGSGDIPEELVEEMAQEELRVAAADLACRQETNYVPRYNIIDERLQAEYVEDHEGDSQLLVQDREERLSR